MVKLKIISDKKDTADVIKSAISAEIKRLEIGLNRTNREIKSFEEKYSHQRLFQKNSLPRI